MAELAIVTARHARLEKDAEAGSRAAHRAIVLANSPTTFLSTVQIGITLIGIVAGAFGGSMIAMTVSKLVLPETTWFDPYRNAVSLGVVVTGITFLSLVFGELLPKRIALAHPEVVAKLVSSPMQMLSRWFSPFVWLLEKVTEFIFRALPIHHGERAQVTEEEIHEMIDQGSELGVIEAAEGNLAGKALRLGDRPASSLMTPRNDLEWIDLNKTATEIWEQVAKSAHSYFLAADGAIENLRGVLGVKDISRYVIEQRTDGLASLLFEPLRIRSNSSALKVIEQFKGSQYHIAVVIDEHDGIDGLITTHDLAEAIVGDLTDAVDEEPEYIKRADGSYLIDADMEINEVLELLNIETQIEYGHEGYHSLGGFVFGQMGHIPVAGESFSFEEFRFEVIDMDRHRVDKVLVTRE